MLATTHLSVPARPAWPGAGVLQMKIPPINASHSPLDATQLAHFNGLVNGLTEQQSAWLLGYFAAIGGLAWSIDSNEAAPGRPSSNASSVPTPAELPVALTILYGSQTNNAANFAKKLHAQASAMGLNATLKSLADYPTSALKSERNLLLVVSTHGEGAPPDSAALMHKFLFGKRAPKLAELRYSVLALGDSSYQHFCKAGKDFDEQLANLGGTRIAPRTDCDLDFAAAAQAWMDVALGKLSQKGPSPVQADPAVAIESSGTLYDKERPFAAQLLGRSSLCGRGSAKKTTHIELSLEGSGIQYQPGDALGVLPVNDFEYVDAILSQQNWAPETAVEDRGKTFSLREALAQLFEITTITRPFIKAYAERSRHAGLAELLSPGKADEFASFARGRELIDVLTDYPIQGLAPEEFLRMTRRLQPRLYSIASSMKAHPDEVHLCVGAVHFESYGRKRSGVCSTYLTERLDPEGVVPVFIQENPGFRLPASPDTPIIMIGPGTGIAPFRAFVEEREAIGAKGKSWLFFGDQHFTTDFLYQVEWQRALKTGTLTRMNVAFSRDTTEKTYVQHEMLKHAREFYSYIESGAHIYVCGDANRMARDVNQALLSLIQAQSGSTAEAAEETLENLIQTKRYQRDVY